MPLGSNSDSPAPYQPKSSGEKHEMRADCSATFGTITATLRTVSSELKSMRNEVGEIGRSQAAQEQSTRGLWHEVRDEINPSLRTLPDRIVTAVNSHEENCPSRRKAMRRAETSDSDNSVDVRGFREEVTGTFITKRGILLRNTSNGHYEVPRPVLWIGGLIGAAVAASGYVIHALGLF